MDYFEQCCNADNVLEKPVEPVVPVEIKSGCGFRNAEGVGFRITGNNDNEAEYAEFPWMVRI